MAELIEVKSKPTRVRGRLGLTSFLDPSSTHPQDPGLPMDRPLPRDRGPRQRGLLALGVQDMDPAGLTPPPGVTIVGASSDHLVVEAEGTLRVGEELGFGVDYSALLRAMTSPFVARHVLARHGVARHGLAAQQLAHQGVAASGSTGKPFSPRASRRASSSSG